MTAIAGSCLKGPPRIRPGGTRVSQISIQELIEAGVHFGHRASRWHPSMAPYIHQKHNSIHIIDLRETMRGLVRACHFITRIVEAGHEVIFVGTKAQAREIINDQATRCGMHWVTHRWLGGTLTNFKTIRSRLRRLEELEELEKDGGMEGRSKKEISMLRRERKKINRNLEGIRKMNRLPGAVIISDIRRDDIAIVDTDCDPNTVHVPIPGNDDAFRSIEVIMQKIADSVVAGRDKLIIRQAAEEKKRAEEEEEAKRKAKVRSAEKEAEKSATASGSVAGAPATGGSPASKPAAAATPPSTETAPSPDDSKPKPSE